MAFVELWDATTPPNTEALSNGDDRIRELKRALAERLSQVLTGWPGVDPIKLDHLAQVTVQEILAVASGVATTVFTGDGASNAIWEIIGMIKDQRGDQIARVFFSQSGSPAAPPQWYLFNHQQGADPVVTFTNVSGALKVTQSTGAVRSVRVSYRRIV